MNLPGIIGTGPRALNWYLSTLSSLAKEKYGEEYVLPLKVLGTEFNSINSLLPNHIAKASSLLEPYFEEMENMTNAPYILANITLHEAVKEFEPVPSYKFINLEKIIDKTMKGDTKSITILGTYHTMQHGYLPGLLKGYNQHIQVFQPSIELRKKVDQLRQEYYTESNPLFAHEVFTELLEQNRSGHIFIIACTELSVALEDISLEEESQKRILNLPKEQCKQLLESASNLHG